MLVRKKIAKFPQNFHIFMRILSEKEPEKDHFPFASFIWEFLEQIIFCITHHFGKIINLRIKNKLHDIWTGKNNHTSLTVPAVKSNSLYSCRLKKGSKMINVKKLIWFEDCRENQLVFAIASSFRFCTNR